MSGRVSDEVIEGHFTRTRNRMRKGTPYTEMIYDWNDNPTGQTITKHRPGYLYVEVLIWEGEEATGEPLGEWEMPHVYRYDHHGAAVLAVAQQTFPADTDPVDYVLLRRRYDGRLERLSGRDTLHLLRPVLAYVGTDSDSLAFLHIHRPDAGTPVTPGTPTMGMLFKIKNIHELKIMKVTKVVEEIMP